MLDNILVHQKNHILRLVYEDKFELALAQLEVLKELWEHCSYGYKYKEIRQRLVTCVQQKQIDADHWKRKQKWDKLLKLLRENNELAT